MVKWIDINNAKTTGVDGAVLGKPGYPITPCFETQSNYFFVLGVNNLSFPGTKRSMVHTWRWEAAGECDLRGKQKYSGLTFSAHHPHHIYIWTYIYN